MSLSRRVKAFDSPALLSDPCFYFIRGIQCDFKYSSSTIHPRRPISSIAGLPAVPQVYPLMISIKVVIVIMTARYPIHSRLFKHCRKQSCINRAATYPFISSAVNLAIIEEIHVLWNRNVHESETSALARVIFRYFVVFLTEPLNLIEKWAIPASYT